MDEGIIDENRNRNTNINNQSSRPLRSSTRQRKQTVIKESGLTSDEENTILWDQSPQKKRIEHFVVCISSYFPSL